MRITPLDIRKQPFRKSFRGFDPDQVVAFLEMVANEFEAVVRQNSEMATQLKASEQRLETYVKIEKTLNETLITAQKTTDDARTHAQKESELIIKDAQIRAGRYEDEARRRVHSLESELVTLKGQRDSFLARFRAMLKTQLELVSTLGEDLGKKRSGGEMDEDETMDEVPAQPTI